MCDLRDAPGDRVAGVSTLSAVVHGERGAVWIIDAFCIAFAATLVFGFAARFVPWRIAVMVGAPLVQFFLYKRWLARGITAEDCAHLAWLGAGLLVAYNVWLALGLPGVTGTSS